MEDFLERTYWSNTIREYLIALAIILTGLLLVKLIRTFALKRIRRLTDRTETSVDDFVVDSIDKYGIPALYISVVFAGINFLTLTERMVRVLDVAFTVAITILAIRFISSVIFALLTYYLKKEDDGEERVKQLGGLMIILNIIIWIIGLLFLFDNVGYDVTAIVAGMGIGGIAVALAAQNILGDLFNYFVIFLDKPFEIGDFVIIDDKLGVIEYIGIKTTRVKSLSGEQVVFSNSDLTNSRIHNYKRMERRRVLFKIGVTYQTELENLKKIPSVLKEIVKRQSPVEFDRAHFSAYGDHSLTFEVVYYVLSSDFNIYMDVQQGINLGIFEEFQKMGVEIAFPTRTIYMHSMSGDDNNGNADTKVS